MTQEMYVEFELDVALIESENRLEPKALLNEIFVNLIWYYLPKVY